MAFGGEVHHGARPVRGEQAIEELAIGDVAPDEHVPPIAREAGEIREVARVGELVEIHHRFGGCREPVEHEVRPDEARAAGDEDHAAPFPAPDRGDRSPPRAAPAFCSSINFRYFWKVLLQPIAMCANPGPPSRKPMRST